MTRRTRDLSQGILQGITRRRQASGLGAGCAEAQADGVPCEDPRRDCASCSRAAAAVSGRPAKPGRRRARR